MIFSLSFTLVLFFFVFASISTSNPIPPSIPGEGSEKGQIQCNVPRAGYQNYAKPKRIKQGEKYLFKKVGLFTAPALMTKVVSCSYHSAISVMNTVPHDISIPYYEIAELARDVRIACDNTLASVNGERYHNNGWRVVVHSTPC